MRFRDTASRSDSRYGRHAAGSGRGTGLVSLGRRGPTLRLAAMLVAMLLVLMAIGQLGRPKTHRAIGQMLGEPTPVAFATPPAQTTPLLAEDALDTITDNAPFRAEEQPAWFALIDRVRRTETDKLSAESVGPVGYAALVSQPEAYRARVLSVAGAVHRVEPVTPAANDLGVNQLWRVTMQPIGGEVWPLTVYTLEEPLAPGEPYDASAVGVFFKKLSYRWSGGVGVTPVVIARRLETTIGGDSIDGATPEQAATTQPDVDFDPAGADSLGRSLLADLGVDLEALRQIDDRRPLKPQDTGGFYAVLGAVQKTPAQQLARLAQAGLGDYAKRQREQVGASRRERLTVLAVEKERRRDRYSVAPLFGDGAKQRGELVVIDAVVRRAVLVDVSQSEAAGEHRVEKYYELEAFAEDSQNLPLVFVMRDLPPGFPVGDAIRQPARLAGFFFKQWAYRSRNRTDEGKDRYDVAPLLIGRAPIPLITPDPSSDRPGLAIGVVVTLALAGVVLATWRASRRDQQYDAATLSRYRENASGAPLNTERLEQLTKDNEPSGRKRPT